MLKTIDQLFAEDPSGKCEMDLRCKSDTGRTDMAVQGIGYDLRSVCDLPFHILFSPGHSILYTHKFRAGLYRTDHAGAGTLTRLHCSHGPHADGITDENGLFLSVRRSIQIRDLVFSGLHRPAQC